VNKHNYEIEHVDDGVWVHTPHPDTGKLIMTQVNIGPDGVIIDVWVEDEDGPRATMGVDWGELSDDEMGAEQ
tara:strand:+ start:3721 stop:3936 length:216 start_codon:yes stop_codon:yes gene_type:complete